MNNNVVIDIAGGSYNGPLRLIGWIFLHPWMTFFICLALCEALEAWGKAFGKRWK